MPLKMTMLINSSKPCHPERSRGTCFPPKVTPNPRFPSCKKIVNTALQSLDIRQVVVSLIGSPLARVGVNAEHKR